jgi:high affinity choline transporter 7
MSAVVVIAYTMVGGMWSVAYTDAFQLGLVVLGLLVALPYALGALGGFDQAMGTYFSARPDRGGVIPPMQPTAFWSAPAIINWWDVSFMLMLGGIPWNCYFQRVLACQTPARAVWHSLLAGLLTISLTIPPLLLGIAAFGYVWPADLQATLDARPALTLPMFLKYVMPPFVALLGLGAIVGAVTSSFSSSILSAASMISWNGAKRLLFPDLGVVGMKRVIRGSVVLLGACAIVLALKVQSVQALWFFTSDLVFVLLFPQLVYALFDPKVNRTGSIVGFAVSFVLRIGGGEPLLGIPHFIPYPEIWSWMSGADAASWYSGETILFPFKTLAASVGMVLIPVVSRLTSGRDPARPLRNVAARA